MAGKDTGHLKVDTGALRDLAGHLGNIHDAVDGATGLVDSYQQDMGSSDVSGAVHGMAADWSDKRKKLLDSLETLSKTAKSAADGYDGVDSHLAQALINADKKESGDSK